MSARVVGPVSVEACRKPPVAQPAGTRCALRPRSARPAVLVPGAGPARWARAATPVVRPPASPSAGTGRAPGPSQSRSDSISRLASELWIIGAGGFCRWLERFYGLSIPLIRTCRTAGFRGRTRQYARGLLLLLHASALLVPPSLRSVVVLRPAIVVQALQRFDDLCLERHLPLREFVG